MNPQVSIIIVNWRSKDYVRACLRSLARAAPEITQEIIVVDGGSFDGCGEMLRAEFPGVIFIQSPDNVGFGRSNNLGLPAATAPAVLLLNPDTEVRPGALQALLGELAARPRAGILGPRLLNTDGSLQLTSVMALPTPLNQALRSDFLLRRWPRSRLWGSGEAYASAQPVVVEAVSGACMLLRTEVMRQLGGFHPDYFMYGEDMDLCCRARRLGLDIVHVPAAEVVHHGGGSSRQQINYFSLLKIREANLRYMHLNHGRARGLAYRTGQTLSAAVRLPLLTAGAALRRGPARSACRASLRAWWLILRWSLNPAWPVR